MIFAQNLIERFEKQLIYIFQKKISSRYTK